MDWLVVVYFLLGEVERFERVDLAAANIAERQAQEHIYLTVGRLLEEHYMVIDHEELLAEVQHDHMAEQEIQPTERIDLLLKKVDWVVGRNEEDHLLMVKSHEVVLDP